MGFIDTLDLANTACQLLGVEQILSATEDSVNNKELSLAYDKVRRRELRRNIWRFATRKVVLRPVDVDHMLLIPPTYDQATTYYIGSIVQDTNGDIWQSRQAENINNPPGGNNEAWDAYYGPLSISNYDSTETYETGELVYVGNSGLGTYTIYSSLISNNADNPATVSAWDATVIYGVEDVVQYLGVNYRSLNPFNLNITPVEGAFWTALPAVPASSKSWRVIPGTMTNLRFPYPADAGPSSDENSRNVFYLPANYLGPALLDSKAGSTSFLGAPAGLLYRDWLFEGNLLITRDSDPISFRFITDITRVRAWDDQFANALACALATQCCLRLTGSTAKLQSIASEYNKFIGEARVKNLIEIGAIEPPEDDFIACRV